MSDNNTANNTAKPSADELSKKMAQAYPTVTGVDWQEEANNLLSGNVEALINEYARHMTATHVDTDEHVRFLDPDKSVKVLRLRTDVWVVCVWVQDNFSSDTFLKSGPYWSREEALEASLNVK